MFTGIVEEMGKVEEIKQISAKAVQIKIKAEEILGDMEVGDSISVNGICLTVTSFERGVFHVDVMPETMQATSLADVSQGEKVNLERSLQAKDRFGGHFVTGHVDGIGKIIRKEPSENAMYYDISLPETLMRYMTLKGSVAVDGISLTLFHVDRKRKTITLSLIPHTVDVTVLGGKGLNDIVNIEADMLAKHVHHYMALQMENKKESGENVSSN